MRLTFPTYEFVFFFLPAALAGYYLLRRPAGRAVCSAPAASNTGALRPDRLFLMICSLLFYLSFGLRNFIVLCAQALLGWFFLRFLLRANQAAVSCDPQTAKTGRAAGRVLFIGAVACCLLSLAFFKYAAPFFPVALSFTTFSLLSLLADVHRGEIKVCALTDYLLWFFFFPKLLQGPIMRFSDFQETVERAAASRPSAERFAEALFFFVLGLSKKVLLADRLATAADFAFAAPENLLWLEAVLSSFTYTFQIYFDFSGYCDMGRACAWLFGFDLPRNFDRPYRAVNIHDFWRRWHSTLSQFFTRYVYIPLGGNRRGQVRTLANTMLVFLLSGLWHGNGWGFLLWGFAHGLLACLSKCLRRPLRLPAALKRALTFLFVNLAWIPFRAASLRDAAAMLRKIFDRPWFALHDKFIDTYRDDLLWYPLKMLGVPDVRTGGLICLWLLLALSAFLVFAAPDAAQMAARFHALLRSDGREAGKGHAVRVSLTAILSAVLFLWCVLSFGEVSSFLYFQF